MNQNPIPPGNLLLDPLNTLPYLLQRKWLNIGKSVVVKMDFLRKGLGVILAKVKDRSKLFRKMDIGQPADG